MPGKDIFVRKSQLDELPALFMVFYLAENSFEKKIL